MFWPRGVVALLVILVQQEVLIVANPCIDTCTDEADGEYQYCSSCTEYVTCATGISVIASCVNSGEWNDNIKSCQAGTSPTCNACTITSTNICAPVGSICTATGGDPSVACACAEGYAGDGLTCTEIQTTTTTVAPETTYSSCADVYARNPSASDGEYMIRNGEGEVYEVYCEFLSDSLYEYIKPTNLASLNIDDQYNDKEEILLRFRLNNGAQYEVKIGQIQKYRSRDISVMYNVNSGFGGIQNSAMGPYLYIGLLPVVGIRHLFDMQGYKMNGRDRNYINCNGSPFSYFVLLFNEAEATLSRYNYNEFQFERWLAALSRNKVYYRQTAEAWFNAGIRVASERELPVQYFSQFEIRFGGCGGYVTTRQLSTVTGITIGLKSDFDKISTIPPTSTTTPISTSTPNAGVTNPTTPVSTTPLTTSSPGTTTPTLPPLPPLPRKPF